MVGRGVARKLAHEAVLLFPCRIEIQPDPRGQSRRLLKLLGTSLRNLLQQLDDL